MINSESFLSENQEDISEEDRRPGPMILVNPEQRGKSTFPEIFLMKEED
jgi:hypothetical protein